MQSFRDASVFVKFCIGAGILSDSRISLIDVGASGGIDSFWRQFEPGLKAVGFDPLVSEIALLNAQETNPNIRYEAAWIGEGPQAPDLTFVSKAHDDNRGPLQPFDVTSARRAMTAASFDIVKDHFNRGAEPEMSDVHVSVDEWLARNDFGQVDILKCDVDGFDFLVLWGARNLLTSATKPLAVKTEAQFHEWRGRRGAAFGDIDRFMRDCGYRLIDLDVYHYTRASLPGPFQIDLFAQTEGGQALWCDALYMLDPVLDPKVFDALDARGDSEATFAKLAVLYEAFGYPDLTAGLLEALEERGQSMFKGVPFKQLLDALTPERNVFGVTNHADYLAAFDADPRRLFPYRQTEQVAEAIVLPDNPVGSVFNWLPGLYLGDACKREENGIIAPAGWAGHMVYGPYVTLSQGVYQLDLSLDNLSPKTGAASSEGEIIVEIVADEVVHETTQVGVGSVGKFNVQTIFRVPLADQEPVFQIRIWKSPELEIALLSTILTLRAKA